MLKKTALFRLIRVLDIIVSDPKMDSIPSPPYGETAVSRSKTIFAADLDFFHGCVYAVIGLVITNPMQKGGWSIVFFLRQKEAFVCVVNWL